MRLAFSLTSLLLLSLLISVTAFGYYYFVPARAFFAPGYYVVFVPAYYFYPAPVYYYPRTVQFIYPGMQQIYSKPVSSLQVKPSPSPTQLPMPSPSPTPSSSKVKEFRVRITHSSGYSPSTITVNLGDTVRILATTQRGTADHLHGITIDEFGVNTAVTIENENNPTVIEFVASKVGTFTIRCGTCSQGTHFQLGGPDFKGRIIVKNSASATRSTQVPSQQSPQEGVVFIYS